MSNNVARGLVTSCLHHMFMEQDQHHTYHDSLATEFARFNLWNHGFDGPWDDSLGSASSLLDDVLEYSIYLHESTISILATVVGSLLMKEFGHVGNQETRATMQSALDDAIKMYPHINNTCWDIDSDETPESATEQLRDIINSLFQLAPALNDQLKKLVERLPNAPAHNSDSALPTHELPTVDYQTNSDRRAVTPWEPPQQGFKYWESWVSNVACSGLNQSIDRPDMSNAWIELYSWFHIWCRAILITLFLAGLTRASEYLREPNQSWIMYIQISVAFMMYVLLLWVGFTQVQRIEYNLEITVSRKTGTTDMRESLSRLAEVAKGGPESASGKGKTYHHDDGKASKASFRSRDRGVGGDGRRPGNR